MSKDSNQKEIPGGYNPVDEDGPHVPTSFEQLFPSFSSEDQEDLLRKIHGQKPLHGGNSIVFRVDSEKIERWPLQAADQASESETK